MGELGEGFDQKMILRGSLERLSPVLMTALTAGIGLIPLVIAGDRPGREILYPVATVILTGFIVFMGYKLTLHWSAWLFGFALFDALTVALVLNEWRNYRAAGQTMRA